MRNSQGVAETGAHTVTFQLDLGEDGALDAYPDDILPVTPESSVGDVLGLLKSERSGCVVVCDQGRLVGVFTERDALRCMATATSFDTPVGQLMSADPVTIREGASVADAIQKMAAGGYRHLPIVDAAGAPTAVAAVHGIVHYLVEHFPKTIYNLPPEPNRSPTEREGA